MVLLVIIGVIFLFGLDFYIQSTTKHKIYVPNTKKVVKAFTGIVLGAKVYKNGKLSEVLKDRVEVALQFYRQGKIKRFLLSGDHGQKEYDEVNSMKNYLIKNGVPEANIFLDHAGFSTYDSMYRAKQIFNCEDVIIFTQNFHVKRAVYIANNVGLNAQGIKTDLRNYGIQNSMAVREKLANVKAFLELLIKKKPRYLGKIIPITGNSSKTYD